jgi:hypothetical protein
LRIVFFLPGVRYGDRYLCRCPLRTKTPSASRIGADREQHSLVRGLICDKLLKDYPTKSRLTMTSVNVRIIASLLR